MNLYISDLHFGHRSIIRYDHRPFCDIEEMDHVMISWWNERVHPDDTVYIVGDFCYLSNRAPEWYLRQLKGHKVLILGNHDISILDNPTALHYLDDIENVLEIHDGDKKIILCHYPMVEFNALSKDSWHIYGHLHKRKNDVYELMKKNDHALNAGSMINNYSPVSLSQLIQNNKIFKQTGDPQNEQNRQKRIQNLQ